jgi:hypothetical protein
LAILTTIVSDFGSTGPASRARVDVSRESQLLAKLLCNAAGIGRADRRPDSERERMR